MAPPEPAPPLSAEALRRGLAGCRIGREIILLQTTTSTNDFVWAQAQEGAAEGLVVFAEQQTAGRGQRGNRWESAPRAGLWFSILLRPKLAVADSPRLTAWAASAVAGTVATELAIAARLKEPNDIYIGDRKVAGVLVELRAQPGAPHVAIAGIGVNISQTAADFSPEIRDRASSLATATGRAVDRTQFAIALLRNLGRTYAETFPA